jgi:hypothetical protein
MITQDDLTTINKAIYDIECPLCGMPCDKHYDEAEQCEASDCCNVCLDFEVPVDWDDIPPNPNGAIVK